MDEKRLAAIEATLSGWERGEWIHSPDVIPIVRDLIAEVRRLRETLVPFAHHALAGWNARSDREYTIRVTEGQVAGAWHALNDAEVSV